MIQLSSLSKSFGDRVLLDAVTWQIDDRERVGLCGPNGAGKTTLLRMLAGLDESDGGTIVKPAALTVGYLPQDGLEHRGRTVFEEASSAFAPLLAMKAEMHELEERMGSVDATESEQAEMLDRYSELSDRFRFAEGYSIDLQVATVLGGLGFATEDFHRPAETFSGGWQMRIALSKLLLGRPGLLLLDEPTNHLDLEARNWLESYLREYPHAVILVSHDRFFLDAVVTKIADLNLRTLTDYHGNYSDYLVERDARIERLRAAKREQDEEVARIKMFIDRFRLQEWPHRSRIEAPAQGVRAARGVRRRLVAHRTWRPHRAGGTERQWQIDADADAVRRGISRSRRAASGASGRPRVLRAGRGDAPGSHLDGL